MLISITPLFSLDINHTDTIIWYFYSHNECLQFNKEIQSIILENDINSSFINYASTENNLVAAVNEKKTKELCLKLFSSLWTEYSTIDVFLSGKQKKFEADAADLSLNINFILHLRNEIAFRRLYLLIHAFNNGRLTIDDFNIVCKKLKKRFNDSITLSTDKNPSRDKNNFKKIRGLWFAELMKCKSNSPTIFTGAMTAILNSRIKRQSVQSSSIQSDRYSSSSISINTPGYEEKKSEDNDNINAIPALASNITTPATCIEEKIEDMDNESEPGASLTLSTALPHSLSNGSSREHSAYRVMENTKKLIDTSGTEHAHQKLSSTVNIMNKISERMDEALVIVNNIFKLQEDLPVNQAQIYTEAVLSILLLYTIEDLLGNTAAEEKICRLINEVNAWGGLRFWHLFGGCITSKKWIDIFWNMLNCRPLVQGKSPPHHPIARITNLGMFRAIVSEQVSTVLNSSVSTVRQKGIDMSDARNLISDYLKKKYKYKP